MERPLGEKFKAKKIKIIIIISKSESVHVAIIPVKVNISKLEILSINPSDTKATQCL